MRKTDKTNEIVAKVNQRIKNRLNVEFTDEEMFDILDSQFAAVAHAINTQKDVVLPSFGKFSAPDYRVKKITKRFAEVGVAPRFRNAKVLTDVDN